MVRKKRPVDNGVAHQTAAPININKDKAKEDGQESEQHSYSVGDSDCQEQDAWDVDKDDDVERDQRDEDEHLAINKGNDAAGGASDNGERPAAGEEEEEGNIGNIERRT